MFNKVEVNKIPKISIVIPVFNGEKYIAQTLDSILNQTFIDFEIICISDCSTDNSPSILISYEAKDTRIRIFTTKSNLGSSAKVLKYAPPFIRGDYFVYSSQDDLFSDDWLEKMYYRAIETGADAVIPELVFYYENDMSKNRSLLGLYGDNTVELSGREAVVYSLNWSIPGNALLSASLVKEVGFYDFGMNADEYTVRVFFLNCNKVVFSEGKFYYRQDNELAITKKITYKTFDYPFTNFKLYQLLKDNNFPKEVYIGEAIKSIKNLAHLCQWLVVNRENMSENDVLEAEKRIEKCDKSLRGNNLYELVSKIAEESA